MAKFSHRLELAANVLIIIVGALLVVTLLKNIYPFSTISFLPERTTGRSIIGSRIEFPSGVLTKNANNIVLGLDVKCRYCKESSEFYKSLSKVASSTGLKILAFFPTPVDESRRYLSVMGIENVEVHQAPLSDINVRGTPTVLLVDGEGKVLDSWVGKIPRDKESDVINRIAGGNK